MVSFAQFSGPEARRQASVAKIHSFIESFRCILVRRGKTGPRCRAGSVRQSLESNRFDCARIVAYSCPPRKLGLPPLTSRSRVAGLERDGCPEWSSPRFRNPLAPPRGGGGSEGFSTGEDFDPWNRRIGHWDGGYSLTDSMSFVKNWSNFVQFVFQLLG